jgi:hypothetical protein
MSSPFSKRFMGKKDALFMTEKQESTFGPEGSNPNPGVYQGIKEADESSPATMKGSPAHSHDPKKLKELQDKLAKVKKGEIGAEGQGGIDYELQNTVENQIKEAKKDHSEKKKLK